MRQSSHMQKKGETAHGMRRPALLGAHAQTDVYPNRPFRVHIAADVFPESAFWAHMVADAAPPFCPPPPRPPRADLRKSLKHARAKADKWLHLSSE